MATPSNLADVSNALSQRFKARLAVQFNRLAVTGRLMPTTRGFGKNIAWDALMGGAQVGVSSYIEGTDVQSSEYLFDVAVPAILTWAHYRRCFSVTETQFDAAATSAGSADELVRLFEMRMKGAETALASDLNKDLINGTGTDINGAPTIIGLLGGALEMSGTYATVSRATYPVFNGNVLSNGNVLRALTLDLLYQLEELIYIASGVKPNLIIASPGVIRRYAGLFEPIRRVDGQEVTKYDTGTTNLSFQDIPMFRDKDVLETNGGTLIMLNTDFVSKTFLPSSQMSSEDVVKSMEVQGEGSNWKGTNDPLGLPFRIVPMGRTGDSLKFMVKCVLNESVDVPNTAGYMSNILV